MALELTKNSKGTEQPSLALSEIWLAKLMDETLANWPNQQISSDTARIWLAIWRELASEFGAGHFQKTLWELCKTSKFCPVPGEIRARLLVIPRVEDEPFPPEKAREILAEIERRRAAAVEARRANNQ